MTLSALHEKFADRVHKMVRSRLNASWDVRFDLSQTAWFEFHLALVSGRYDARRSDPVNYLRGIVRNLVQRYLRERARILPIDNSESSYLIDNRIEQPATTMEHCARIGYLRSEWQSGFHNSHLSREEQEVMHGIARGTPERKLAATLGRARSTVHGYKEAAIRKVANRFLKVAWDYTLTRPVPSTPLAA